MPPRHQAIVVEQRAVSLAENELGQDAEGRKGFLALQRCAIDTSVADARTLMCTLPPLHEGGALRVATISLAAQPPAISIAPGAVVDGNAAVAADTDGQVSAVPLDPALGLASDVATRWVAPLSALAPVIRLATVSGHAAWRLDALDRAMGPRWSVSSATVSGVPEPESLAVAPDGSLVVLAVRRAVTVFEYELVAFAGSDGTVHWRVPLSAIPWKVLFAPRGDTLAVVAKDATRCESCAQAIIASAADGRARLAVPLESRIAHTSDTAGFTGEHLWFYRFEAEHMPSDIPVLPAARRRTPNACDYELHAVARGSQAPRTLLDADGAWKQLAGTCQVRALLPLPAGHLAAVRVLSDRELAVVELDTPP